MEVDVEMAAGSANSSKVAVVMVLEAVEELRVFQAL